MTNYIEYESEFFRAVVGPFASRSDADAWAHEQQQDGAWQGATVYTPAAAARLISDKAAKVADREPSCSDCGHAASRHWKPGGCHGTSGSIAAKCRCSRCLVIDR